MIAKCSIYARYSGRPVCRGMRPVGREEGILVVEWSLTGTATHCFGPEFRLRRVVRKARSDQSALVMPWRLYFSHLLAYCIVSILNSILWTLYSVVYDSKVIAHGSIWGEVPCIPDHPVHMGSTPSNPSIHIYPRITIKTRQSEMANTSPATCQCLATFIPLKSKMLIFFRDVISLLARVIILLIDTATQEVPMNNI